MPEQKPMITVTCVRMPDIWTRGPYNTEPRRREAQFAVWDDRHLCGIVVAVPAEIGLNRINYGRGRRASFENCDLHHKTGGLLSANTARPPRRRHRIPPSVSSHTTRLPYPDIYVIANSGQTATRVS